MSIFCVGQAAFDITAPYTGPLVANQKYRVLSPSYCPGAPALNAACLCARWGAEVELVARIGDDAYGKRLKETLTSCGVGMDHLLVGEDVSTSYSFIAVDDASGERTIFNVPSQGDVVLPPLPSDSPSVILSDGHEAEASLKIMEAFPHAYSIIDAGTYRESTYTVAREVDCIICSEDFARQYTGRVLHDPDDLLEADSLLKDIERVNGGVAVITLGDRGLIYRDAQGRPIHMLAFPVEVVDTTGAGDIFHGAAAYGLERGWDLPTVLRVSSMASAISVGTMGSYSSIPELEVVLELLGFTSNLDDASGSN
ncbi:MAG: PfkB family carbohydrate kinase [Collinsella sp.]|nr:PfkB family carbohydrate kinase [Collinsella sp.]